MSADANIQVVKQAYADFGRGDIAAILAVLDPQVEWSTPEAGLKTGGVRRGHQQVTEFFQAVGETWDFQAFEPKEFIASGDSVAACGSYTAKTRATGHLVTCDWVMVWKFRQGKVTHFQEYTDTAALVRAATVSSASA